VTAVRRAKTQLGRECQNGAFGLAVRTDSAWVQQRRRRLHQRVSRLRLKNLFRNYDRTGALIDCLDRSAARTILAVVMIRTL